MAVIGILAALLLLLPPPPLATVKAKGTEKGCDQAKGCDQEWGQTADWSWTCTRGATAVAVFLFACSQPCSMGLAPLEVPICSRAAVLLMGSVLSSQFLGDDAVGLLCGSFPVESTRMVFARPSFPFEDLPEHP